MRVDDLHSLMDLLLSNFISKKNKATRIKEFALKI